jgi:hypothetical protein
VDLTGTSLIVHPALELNLFTLMFGKIADIDPGNLHEKTSFISWHVLNV